MYHSDDEQYSVANQNHSNQVTQTILSTVQKENENQQTSARIQNEPEPYTSKQLTGANSGEQNSGIEFHGSNEPQFSIPINGIESISNDLYHSADEHYSVANQDHLNQVTQTIFSPEHTENESNQLVHSNSDSAAGGSTQFDHSIDQDSTDVKCVMPNVELEEEDAIAIDDLFDVTCGLMNANEHEHLPEPSFVPVETSFWEDGVHKI